MRIIWVVEGNTGEYSDHIDWPVKAFTSEASAQRLVVEAQARANEIFQLRQSIPWGNFFEMENTKNPKALNEFDPKMKMDYTATHYQCYPIELVEE